MRVRVLLAPMDDALRRRTSGLLPRDIVAVHEFASSLPPWQVPSLPDSDLVIAQRELLPEGDGVHRLRSLPGAPQVVLLEAGEVAVRGSGGPPEDAVTLSAAAPDAVLEVELERLVRGRLPAPDPAGPPAAEEPTRFGEFRSRSPAMREFLRIAQRVCATDATVLILGETGVGKERLARTLHEESPRRSGPFIAVHCGAIPESLLESELFGHERGAFTGAVRARRGYLELADAGTLFLDEIGDMPTHLQGKLLRVLQERKVQRLGSESEVAVDVRVIAATHRDLHREMAEGRFRADLYYRLSVVTLCIPPLRERREDIEPLALGFLQRFGHRALSPASEFDPEVLQALLSYPWPGNVRELANVIERAVLLAPGRTITLADLPEGIAAWSADRTPELQFALPPLDPHWLGQPLAVARSAFLLAFERRYLEGLLAATGGRIGETARRAGIDPRSLYTKMRRHGLRKEDYRPEPDGG